MADQGTEGLLSPFLRRRRIAAAKPFLRGRILDFGCGSGALASVVDSAQYFGVEIDQESLCRARSAFPNHRFMSDLPDSDVRFDTIVSLAVIEHVSDPVKFLIKLRSRLAELDDASIVISTPHPSVDWIHHVGATIGLFSKHANDEHEELLNKRKLISVGKEAGLFLALYRHFLLGANQLAVYRTAA